VSPYSIDCTADVCNAGKPELKPAAAMTACGNKPGMVCDGKGSCTGCTDASDCKGSDDACRKRSCAMSACAYALTAEGTLLSEPKNQDCKAKACGPNGSLVEVADDSDIPADDANACTVEACKKGAKQSLPAVVGTSCQQMGGKVCDGGGQCVACNSGADCGAASGACKVNACENKACVEKSIDKQPAPPDAQKPGDCNTVMCNAGVPTKSALDSDLPVDGKSCTQDVCMNGEASHPAEPAGAKCNEDGGKVCDGKGACVQCAVDGDCAMGTCKSGKCEGCSMAQTCLSLGLSCGTPSDGCGNPLNCSGAKNGFETDVDCGGPVAKCATRCAKGKSCSMDSDCESNHCAQGVCCDEACSGKCQSCKKVDTGGDDGMCGYVKSGLDPIGECDAQGTTCSAGILKSDFKCDGSGACKSNASVSCNEYKCDAQGKKCMTTCTAHADCAAGHYCTGNSKCEPKQADGKLCSAGVECASGHCYDGVCCNSFCSGACEACVAVYTGKADGICAPVAKGTDPKAACGATKTCDGAASCKSKNGQSCAAAAACASGFCPVQDGVCWRARTARPDQRTARANP
jgi:hypothetical protein